MTQKYNDYKSYCLFNDVDDVELRTRNRAVVMCNIAEDGIDRKSKRMTAKAANLILGYFMSIEPNEREEAQDLFRVMMGERGFALVPR